MVFIDKWSLFEGYFVLFNQERVIEVWPFLAGWSLTNTQNLYSETPCCTMFYSDNMQQSCTIICICCICYVN